MSEVIVDIPEAFGYLLQPSRYKSAMGGRGRGASWSFARVLATKASYEKKRILCTREYQNSIKDSVYKILVDQITLLGLSDYYNINKTEITSRIGSEFLFKGLQHPLEIKSIEGIDIVWLEEAQNVSEDSWKFLIPTIRKAGSEIWLSWNTGKVNDPTYIRFVTNKPEDCINKLLTYKDNPHFPEVLRKEMEHDKKVDYDAYMHIWEGQPLKLSEALVFKNKFVIEDFDSPFDAQYYYGADWGFANDPCVLIRCFIMGDELFIDYEAWGVGVEFEQIPELFDSVPGSRNHEIPADSSRPETISYVKRQGFSVKSCRKVATTKAGFVQDGISFIRKFSKIHIHTRCKHTKDEFEHYSFKTDKKTGEILPILLDSFNHCFVGDTKVATISGEVNIKDIKVGDLVLTRKGYKRVLKTFDNGINEVDDYLFCNGRVLRGTKTHGVITPNGKVEIKDINNSDQIYLLIDERNDKWIQVRNARWSYLMANLIEDIRKEKSKNIWQRSDLLQKNGMQAKKGMSGINNMLQIVSEKLIPKHIFANTVKGNTLLINQATANSAPMHVSQQIEGCQEWTTKFAFVQRAAKVFQLINILKQKHAQENAEERVYNIEVEDQHEYFANGILVANCVDALRYSLEDLIQGQFTDWEKLVND